MDPSIITDWEISSHHWLTLHQIVIILSLHHSLLESFFNSILMPAPWSPQRSKVEKIYVCRTSYTAQNHQVSLFVRRWCQTWKTISFCCMDTQPACSSVMLLRYPRTIYPLEVLNFPRERGKYICLGARFHQWKFRQSSTSPLCPWVTYALGVAKFSFDKSEADYTSPSHSHYLSVPFSTSNSLVSA